MALPSRDVDHVLSANPWRELHGARIFITGGTGFIGTWLLETLLAARERFSLDTSAVVLTRNAAAFRAKAPHLASAVTLIEGDVRTFAFPAGEFPFVIHAATDASAKLNDERPREMFDTIVSGTRRVLEFAEQRRARRFLLTSSGAVYGQQPYDVDHVDEEFRGDPKSAYAEGKRAAELLCATAPFDALIARCFAFVGPHLPLDIHFAIGNFIGDALAGRALAIRGDGTPRRSYLYAADLAIWLWTILFRGAPRRPYNVGSERSVSILETAQAVAAAVDPPLEITVAGVPDPHRPAERYVPSTARARRELGVAETVPLEDAIARTLAWHRAQK